MKALNAAHVVLCDCEKRHAYDEALRARESELAGNSDCKPQTSWQGTQPSAEMSSKPMSAWTGLGIAALIVVGIMVAMSLSDSRMGRIAVVLGCIALLVLFTYLLARRIKDLQRNAVDATSVRGISYLLTALVWGWVPLLSGLPSSGSLLSVEVLSLIAVYVAAWVPAYAACHVLLRGSADSDMAPNLVRGYLSLMVLVQLGALMLGNIDDVLLPDYPLISMLRGDMASASLGRLISAVVGAGIAACVATLMLLGIGTLGSATAGFVCSRLSAPLPRSNTTTLLVGWAAIPATSLIVAGLIWI